MIRSSLSVVAILFLLVALAACGGPKETHEIVFTVFYPADFTGDRSGETDRVAAILVKRAGMMGWEGSATVDGETEIRFTAITGEDVSVTQVRRVLSQERKLEIYACAERKVQEKFNNDKDVPEGYKVLKDAPREHRPSEFSYHAWGYNDILVREKTVINNSAITAARAKTMLGVGGEQWTVEVNLNEDGSKRFDTVAGELFKYKPSGVMAILVDGEVRSMPIVQTEKFGGTALITGSASESEARELAGILGQGSLPYPVGSWIQIKPPGESFAILMPKDPYSTTEKSPFSGRLVDVEYLSVEVPEWHTFALIYFEIPGGIAALKDPQAGLDNAKNGAIKSMEGRAVTGERIKFGQHPGWAVTFETPDDDKVALRMYLTKNRLYQVIASGKMTAFDDAVVKRFQESFQLLGE